MLARAACGPADESGEPDEPAEAAAGTAAWSEDGPPHATENVGENDFAVVRLEVKKKPTTSMD